MTSITNPAGPAQRSPSPIQRRKSPPLVIPVFIPQIGCPHQCAFCNQTLITDKKAVMPDCGQISGEVTRYLYFKGNRSIVQLAFFGGTFLGLEKTDIKALLDCGQNLVNRGSITTMRFSTRPDTITRWTLDGLQGYAVQTIEIGAQSMDDQVLSLAKRGHTAGCTVRAVEQLKARGYETGIQIMTGLPGETRESAIESAEKAADICPDFVRIYPLVILKKSLVHKWFLKGEFTPLSLAECVTRVKEIFLIFEKKNIPVIRMGLQTSPSLQEEETIAAGPWHPAFGHLVFSEIFLDKTLALLKKALLNSSHTDLMDQPITLCVHPASESRLRGNKNTNIKKISALYPGINLDITTDAALGRDQVSLQ